LPQAQNTKILPKPKKSDSLSPGKNRKRKRASESRLAGSEIQRLAVLANEREPLFPGLFHGSFPWLNDPIAASGVFGLSLPQREKLTKRIAKRHFRDEQVNLHKKDAALLPFLWSFSR